MLGIIAPAMQEKIEKILKHPRTKELSDTRVLGLMAFGIIALLVTWSGVKSIQTNYDLQKQISKLTQENSVQKLANENVKLRTEYLKTDEYLELSARRQFGKAAPGETLYIIPKKVSLARTIPVAEPKDPKKVAEDNKPTYQKNLEAWKNFFFGDKTKN